MVAETAVGPAEPAPGGVEVLPVMGDGNTASSVLARAETGAVVTMAADLRHRTQQVRQQAWKAHSLPARPSF